MELALNTGTFEVLDRQEIYEVEGGSPFAGYSKNFFWCAVGAVLTPPLAIIFLELAALSYIVDKRIEQR